MHGAEMETTRSTSLRTPGILLGLGLGGFIDGIGLHQILQWHHLLSETDGLNPDSLSNLRANVVADGLFHLATWFLVLIGVLTLAELARRHRPIRPVRHLLGWMAVGWGIFNLVEGLVNHHVLQIHRVRPAAENPLVYDLGFLTLGALLVVVGLLIIRTERTTRHLN